MSLSNATFYTQFITAFNAFCSLNPNGTPKVDASGVPVPSVGNYPAEFASSYRAYTLTGQVLGATHGAENIGIIESWLNGPDTTVSSFAQALAAYWSTVLTVPGAPAHGGTSVVSVTNNAASLVSAFEASLNATATENVIEPIFSTFLNNVKNIALSQVVWTVVELMPPTNTPTPFMETIS